MVGVNVFLRPMSTVSGENPVISHHALRCGDPLLPSALKTAVALISSDYFIPCQLTPQCQIKSTEVTTSYNPTPEYPNYPFNVICFDSTREAN